MKDRGRVNWINAGRKKRGKRSSRQPALRDEAEKKLKKEKCVYGSKLWRERETESVTTTWELGRVCAACQYKC